MNDRWKALLVVGIIVTIIFGWGLYHNIAFGDSVNVSSCAKAEIFWSAWTVACLMFNVIDQNNQIIDNQNTLIKEQNQTNKLLAINICQSNSWPYISDHSVWATV